MQKNNFLDEKKKKIQKNGIFLKKNTVQGVWVSPGSVTPVYLILGDICVLSGPRIDAAVQSLTDPANDLLHARLPCPAPGHWAV